MKYSDSIFSDLLGAIFENIELRSVIRRLELLEVVDEIRSGLLEGPEGVLVVAGHCKELTTEESV